MKNRLDLASVILLPALWGASFVLQRLLSPVMGGLNMAFWRLVIAGTTLVAVLGIMRIELNWRLHWRAYLLGGLLTTALPWGLTAFGAQHLPASYLSIASSTVPLWATLSGALLLGERITLPVVIGLVSGMAGIWVITWHDEAMAGAGSAAFLPALTALLGGAMIAGATGAWVKRVSTKTPVHALSCGTALTGALLLAPSQIFPASRPIDATMLAQLLFLGIACSGFAQLLFFRLISRVTTAQALATTYLNPAFTVLWAWLFLGEAVTARIIVGCLLVLAGTSLITLVKTAPRHP